nr:hypothetical protein [Tanacetum cinerariifolium]GFA20666.1 hypothetical protein [Tanacetum cinerariifolium]
LPHCIRLNIEGILIAVLRKENGINTFANLYEIMLLRTMENSPSCDPSRVAFASAAVVKLLIGHPMPIVVASKVSLELYRSQRKIQICFYGTYQGEIDQEGCCPDL